MTDQPPLTVSVEQIGTQAVVRCSGKLVSSTTGALHACVKPLLTPHAAIVLDLSELTFMDSMGLGAIATLYVSAKKSTCRLELVNLRPRIRDLFTVTHLLSLFEPCGTTNAIIP